MVGGYQLISLKDYIFDLTDTTAVDLSVEQIDLDKFKILFNTNKPIICKDIAIKIGDKNKIIFDNILLFNYNYFVQDELSNTKLIGLLHDFGSFFSPFAMISIDLAGEDVIIHLVRTEEL